MCAMYLNNDEETGIALKEPLLKKHQDNIQDQLRSLTSNIKKLEDNAKKIGTGKDNKGLRQEIHNLLILTSQKFSGCKDSLTKYLENRPMEISQKDHKRNYDQYYTTFKSTQKRFEAVGHEITTKEKLYIENARKSIAQPPPPGYYSEMFIFESSDEYRREEEKQSQLMQGHLVELNEAGFMEEVILERQEGLDRIEKIMMNVNQLTNDLAVEVKQQDEKIEQICDNVKSSKENTEKALPEVQKSEKYQKKAHKCMWWIIGIILIAVIIVVVIVVVVVLKKKK